MRRRRRTLSPHDFRVFCYMFWLSKREALRWFRVVGDK